MNGVKGSLTNGLTVVIASAACGVSWSPDIIFTPNIISPRDFLLASPRNLLQTFAN